MSNLQKDQHFRSSKSCFFFPTKTTWNNERKTHHHHWYSTIYLWSISLFRSKTSWPFCSKWALYNGPSSHGNVRHCKIRYRCFLHPLQYILFLAWRQLQRPFHTIISPSRSCSSSPSHLFFHLHFTTSRKCIVGRVFTLPQLTIEFHVE